jgi:hypothetical protein
MVRGGCRVAVILATVLTATSISPVKASSNISGARDEVRMEVENEDIESVLATLRERYGLIYQSKSPLSLSISGTYQGSLASVLRQMLREYNFVIRVAGELTELNIIGPIGQPPPPPIEPPAPRPVRKELPI